MNPTLQAEREHMSRARADLAQMRERVENLQVQGGDRVSMEYLAATLHRRAAALVDDANTGLFFGRTDHTDGARWYIGRRHVADPDGNPVVIDWRAEVSRAFYRASRTEQMGVTRRRRFGLEGGEITAYEDEFLAPAQGVSPQVDGSGDSGDSPDGGSSAGSGEVRSGILAREIERPRVGPMRDIVATIQPEQDVIVRADVSQSVCVQGAPGTGKTAVGLHRAAWLLYAHRERLDRAGVLVVGPNASFLEHVAAVLPSLGEVRVRHTTVEGLVTAGLGGTTRSTTAAARGSSTTGSSAATQAAGSHLAVTGRDRVEVARLKGDARLAEVLHRAVWSQVGEASEPLVLPRGSRRWRLPAYQACEIVDELRSRGVRYLAARDMMPQRLSHALLVLMEEAGDSPDDRIQDAVARSREVRRYVDALWPALDPKALLARLYTDADLRNACGTGILDANELDLLMWATPPRSVRSARWSAADAVLLDELGDVLRRTPSLGHVVLDEAQDLSPMQLRAVGRRCSTGSVTVLGDIAQGTTPWATPSWQVSLHHLGHEQAHLEVLDRGFRVPKAVIEYAARLLPSIAPGMAAPTSVREDAGSLVIEAVSAAEAVWVQLATTVAHELAHEGSIGVIVADAVVTAAAAALTAGGIAATVLGGGDLSADGSAEELLDSGVEHGGLARVSLVPASTAKGLEYDRVVVVEPTAIAAAEPDERTGLRRLYVVLTRAVTALTVIHHHPLPAALA
jgi:DNA helicase IV